MDKYLANLIASGADPALIAKLGGEPAAEPAPAPAPAPVKAVKKTAKARRK